ncbi:MAG: hypothetical protein DMG07_25415 [Acidobacteria bacterium]|nr:MAG: hypothetical protein DMG07_25415 [Acidobacteriota bacterium]
MGRSAALRRGRGSEADRYRGGARGFEARGGAAPALCRVDGALRAQACGGNGGGQPGPGVPVRCGPGSEPVGRARFARAGARDEPEAAARRRGPAGGPQPRARRAAPRQGRRGDRPHARGFPHRGGRPARRHRCGPARAIRIPARRARGPGVPLERRAGRQLLPVGRFRAQLLHRALPRYYQADVTRTFPVSASFTDEQRRIYRIVLEAQNAALAQVRPGATFRELNRAARDVIERAGYGKYWLHGVSHYIGMSTHDVGEPVAFEPGVVVTVEPGIYIAEKNLGVRIEDTVLVTQNGHESLSRDVPREIDEIEKLRKSGASDPGLPFRLALPGLR